MAAAAAGQPDLARATRAGARSVTVEDWARGGRQTTLRFEEGDTAYGILGEAP